MSFFLEGSLSPWTFDTVVHGGSAHLGETTSASAGSLLSFHSVQIDCMSPRSALTSTNADNAGCMMHENLSMFSGHKWLHSLISSLLPECVLRVCVIADLPLWLSCFHTFPCAESEATLHISGA